MLADYIHVLGADIPHHNKSVIDFFESVIEAPDGKKTRLYVVVGQGSSLRMVTYKNVDISFFYSRFAAAIRILQDCLVGHSFFFHGQFNQYIWLLLLIGSISPEQFHWFIWGGDLYHREKDQRFLNRIYKKIKIIAFHKVINVYGLSVDTIFFSHNYNSHAVKKRLYFPAPLPDIDFIRQEKKHDKVGLSLLIGNSGDINNNHFDALDALSSFAGEDIHISLVLNYPPNNTYYYDSVEKHAYKIFGMKKIKIIRELLSYATYLQLLASIDIGIFYHDRQQGVGTIGLMALLGKSIYIKHSNPMFSEFNNFAIHLGDADKINSMTFAEFCGVNNSLGKEPIETMFSPYVKKFWMGI